MKRRKVTTALAEHAEDIALACGCLLLGVGAGARFGYAVGLIVVGALLVAYGVWITERRPG